MIVACFTDVLDAEWLNIAPILVGGVPVAAAAPARYVLVSSAGKRLLRVDLHPYGPDCFAFEETIIWRDHLVIGFGSHVHVVGLTDGTAISVSLGSYFGHLYPAADYLLVASGERLLRIEPDFQILWRSEILGIDGVVVSEPGPPIIEGDGEWDPPGGWAPFALVAESGRPI